MLAALVQVHQLALSTLQQVIVESVSFTILPGEIVALTGKSGSGKTSVANAILGYFNEGIFLKSGNIEFVSAVYGSIVLPKDLEKWNLLRGSEIGFIQQDVFGAFDPTSKIGGQLSEIVKLRTGRNTRAEEMMYFLKATGIAEPKRILQSYPHQLSGGQLQRCLIALMAMIRPALLVVDEPTSAIDKITQEDILSLFKWLRAEFNMAIICITHDRHVVNEIADREITLDKHDEQNDGQIKQQRGTKNLPILEVCDLTYRHTYGGLVDRAGAGITEINFTLHKSECIGIVGPSGSGKSTIAQLLVGLFVPQRGSISINGKEIDFYDSKQLKLLRKNIQLVMQDGRGSLHPHKTIIQLLDEVVKFNSIQGYDPQHVLAEVGLEKETLYKKPSQLSGGECLRVSIARALLVKPQILICDESTSALDEYTRDAIVRMLDRLRTTYDLSILLISHDIEVIHKIADTILLLDHGKVMEQGAAHQIISKPQSVLGKKLFEKDATS